MVSNTSLTQAAIDLVNQVLESVGTAQRPPDQNYQTHEVYSILGLQESLRDGPE